MLTAVICTVLSNNFNIYIFAEGLELTLEAMLQELQKVRVMLDQRGVLLDKGREVEV